MPGFVRTKRDEAKWQKAKSSASKSKGKDEESFTDQDWALVNHIYHKMKKGEDIAGNLTLIESLAHALKKAKQKLFDPNDMGDADEFNENEDFAPAEQDDANEEAMDRLWGKDQENDETADEDYDSSDADSEDNPGNPNDADDSEDETSKWLKENDPNFRENNEDDYSEYSDNEDEQAHQQGIKEDIGVRDNPNDKQPKMQQEEKEDVSGRFRQPSKEELTELRRFTRPWEQRLRETKKLQADPNKNPVLAQQGNLIEARNKAHADRHAEFQKLINSDAYRNADLISQMEMEDNFQKDWHNKNPEHLANAINVHNEAHQKGEGIKQRFKDIKEENIRHIAEGGAKPDEIFSTEAALQHAGGAKGEEGTVGTVIQDPAAQFAMGNQEFIRQFARDLPKRGEQPKMEEGFGEEQKKDVKRILGDAPAKHPKFEQFFSDYYPLISMNARRVNKTLGIDPKHPDRDIHEGLMQEAGMHGLVQAINDYDHDHPSKASFATHASNKIKGLQMTAMKSADQIPEEIRRAKKEFEAKRGQAKAQAIAPEKPKVEQLLSSSKHPDAANISDRHNRVKAIRIAAGARKPMAPTPIPPMKEPEESTNGEEEE